MGVCLRYTNIPQNESIKVVETTLKRKGKHTRSKRTTYSFTFSTKRYFQIEKCAMGTKCDPSYANIFMVWELNATICMTTYLWESLTKTIFTD